MIVVSDTSPILNLALIGELDLLNELFSVVVIPSGVQRELAKLRIQLDSTWIDVTRANDRAAVARLRSELDAGESEAIVAAVELGADLLLIDEKRGRRIASERGLRIMGLLGVLAEAKQRGLISECRPLLDEMVRVADFWISNYLRARFLNDVGE